MSTTRKEKEKILETLKDNFGKMKIAVFADYFGLKVKEMQELKRLIKKDGGEYLVTKKTLAKLATGKANLKEIDFKGLEGGLSIIFGYSDEVAPVKTLVKFAKDHKALKVKGGILEKEFISLEKILVLSKLPTKAELISNLLYQIKAPISCFANVLQNNLRGLVCVLNNYQEKINK